MSNQCYKETNMDKEFSIGGHNVITTRGFYKKYKKYKNNNIYDDFIDNEYDIYNTKHDVIIKSKCEKPCILTNHAKQRIQERGIKKGYKAVLITRPIENGNNLAITYVLKNKEMLQNKNNQQQHRKCKSVNKKTKTKTKRISNISRRDRKKLAFSKQ